MNGEESENKNGRRLCPECKCAVNDDAKYCPECGANLCRKPSVEENYDPFDYPPQMSYGQIKETCSEIKKFCGKCGSALKGGEAFCGKCGTPTGIAENKQACKNIIIVADEPEEQPTENELKRRKLSGIFASVAVSIAVLGLLFTLAPFLGFSYRDGRTVSAGLSTVWAMLGGDSQLADTGVRYEVLRFAGWAYFAFILAALAFGVCAVIYVTGKKDVNPLFLLPTACVLLAVGIVLLVLDIVACAQIEVEHGAVFMGGIGMFVFALAAFAFTLLSALYSAKTYKKSKNKKVSGRTVVCIVAACIAVLFSAYTVKNPARIGAGTDFSLWDDASGFAYIDISERSGDYYLGMTVVHLRGLEKGETYKFSVRFGSFVSAEELEDCVSVYFDSDIADATAYEVITSARPLETNQSSGTSKAAVTFTYTGGDDLAVAVILASTTKTSVRFTYGFDDV